MNDDKMLKAESAVKYDGEYKVVHFKDYLLANSNAGKGNKRFRSGFGMFDEKLGGIETGEVVVISGKRKEGKTLFAESLIRSMFERDPSAKTMILSYEVQTEKMIQKYVDLESSPIYVPMQLKTMDFQWLKERCLEAKLKHHCRIVLIDHLHFMVDMNTRQNMSLNIGGFMRLLKHEIALGMNMGVILIAHQGQTKEGREASIDNIRDSSFVGQESDSVLIVSRRKNFDSVEMNDIREQHGDSKADKIHARVENADVDDKYSAGLALVEISRTRRTGTYEYRKVFQKTGEFLEVL